MAKILSGKETAEEVLLKLRAKIVEADKREENLPGLAVLLVGNDPASVLYVRNKKRACHKVGITFNDYCFCAQASEKDILETLEFLNNDPAIFGIIVQLPLPKNIDTAKIINAISPAKDVDGFHPENIKKLLAAAIGNMEKDGILLTPPVLKSVITLLDFVEEPLAGKKGVIIAKNEIFAHPLAELMKLKKINLEIVSPDSKDINKLQDSDIIISAAGRPNFVKEEMIKEDVIIIDVGTTLVDEKLIGDVDFKGCEDRASYITPVPGGIGPLTVAYLLENVVRSWESN
ncbi:MAG: tetrahydrofolate dehydrogenase/cyclohydrolase catalytic domain-containing protein [bacterium]